VDEDENGHKILLIDSNCDDINEYEVDLTAEIGNNDYFMCRWVRALVPELGRVIHDGEAAALPVYEAGETTFINAFKTALDLENIVDTYGATEALDIELSNLYAEGYEYNSALADAMLDPDLWNEPMRDLLVTLSKPEYDNDMLFNYLPYVENQPLADEVQWWVCHILFALWADQKRVLETWTWDMMAHPIAGDCDNIRTLPASFYQNWGLDIIPEYVEPVVWQTIFDRAFPSFILTWLKWATESNGTGGNTFRIGVIWADDIESGIDWLMSANPETEVREDELNIVPERAIVYLTVQVSVNSEFQTSQLDYIELYGRGDNPFTEE
jgi:hypothetical protein